MNWFHQTQATTHAAAFALCLCAAVGVQAQTVYRIVGADGRITFSDKPPASAEQGKMAPAGSGAAAASSGSLPFELRQVASRYPVVLYSAPDCGPCSAGRSMLGNRGIPFTERNVTTAEDLAALKRVSGDSALPFLTVGGQHIKGYSDVEWTQYLDAAGYPKVSMLPAGYRQAPASPLVVVDKAAAAKAEAAAEARPEPAAPPAGPAPANPAGIRF
jgi:glutaredoxin